MSEQRQGVILYGYGVDAVAEALRDLDPRYVLVDHVLRESGKVPVLRRRHAAEADAVRDAAPDVSWRVVDLHRPGIDAEHARDPLLWLNTSQVDPGLAARTIDQSDLLTWYAIFNPIRVDTVDGGPPADDYSNLRFTVPDGNRMVAHAVREGGTAPECLRDAEQVLPSQDLWALAPLRNAELCQACTRRHGQARETTAAECGDDPD
ncbi:hypothetical protein [Actinoplanes regularis]|uniref:hypothetical protein n=1 Tax=Actinoplanes regularis TaxID=52697 RepID=UPI002555259C|nr:hypothetical protein [Actinoplanes regularis]